MVNAQNYDWIVQFGPSPAADIRSYTNDITSDSDGNLYIVGGVWGVLPGQTSSGYLDAFVRKLDGNGNEVWTRQFGTSQNDSAGGVALDKQNNIYVSGGTDGLLPGQVSQGSSDAFVRKYDNNGNEIWTRQFGTSYGEGINKLVVDNAGNLYTIGSIDIGATDAFITKLDASGNQLWTRQFGSPTWYDDARGVALDTSGNVYVIGKTTNLVPGFSSGSYARKYDSGGNQIWTSQWSDGTTGSADGIVIGNNNEIYIGGVTVGVSAESAYLRKIDTSGNVIWDEQFGQPSGVRVLSVALDGQGAIYTVGVLNTTRLPTQVYSGGSSDAFIRKYDSNANIVWTREFGSNLSDSADGVVTAKDKVYIIGHTYGGFSPDHTGSGDSYLARFPQASNLPNINTPGVVWTVAGMGAPGFNGDGKPSIETYFNGLSKMAVGGDGNIYLIETNPSRIRKADPLGVVTTIAGNGINGYAGDGGLATAASLNFNQEHGGVAISGTGNIYIADTKNNRIRKVDTNGIINTIAGTGIAGYSGDGGPAILANLSYPSDIEVDIYENIYFIDRNNSWRVRKIDVNGVISTLAGDGQAGYQGDGGLATSARLNYPTGVAVDRLGNIFIADTKNNRIREIDHSTGIITTIAGNGTQAFGGDGGPATAASINYPSDVGVDNKGNIYIPDNCRIRKINSQGIINTIAGTGNCGPSRDGFYALEASISPWDIKVVNGDTIYFGEHQWIRKIYLGIQNAEPVANVGMDLAGNEGQQFTFDGSGSTDPDGTGDITGYSWNFGDGGTASGQVVNHTYSDDGVYTATLTVTDVANQTSSDTATVTVNNIAPVISLISPIALVLPGVLVSVNANFFDTGILDTHVAAFDWGDGVVTQSVVSETNGSGSVTGSHTYTLPGVYAITLSVTDKDGASSLNLISVTVLTPAQATQNLIDLVETFNLQQGIENGLDAKLNNAISALTDLNQHNNQAAIASLQAFINAVNAQKGNHITNAQADQLIFKAQQILNNF